ncbi:MAG: hypothetical protein C5S43_04070 [Candidatus Methanocomedens sp.]|nr:MAG: hypothetical protein C5S43_04070 [ANME-2 cluster archaeon]
MRFEDLSRENLWWKFGNEFQRYDRHLKELKEAFIEFKRKPIDLAIGNIYVIRGMRQIGKTTYIKQTILRLINEGTNPQTILFISCDRLSSRKELHNLVSNFIQQNIEAQAIYVFLDEITYLKDWILELKTIADGNYIDRMVVVATGSNPIKLKEKAERLPGRRVEGNEYYFKPLSFRDFALQSIERISEFTPSKELANALNKSKNAILDSKIDMDNFNISTIKKALPFKEELDWLLEMYILTGGIPLVVNDYLAQKYYHESENIDGKIYETFIRLILGDITKLRRSETTAKEILKNIAIKYSSRYSFTTIGKSAGGIAHQTVIEYLEMFENSLLVDVLSSYDFTKKSPRFRGDKKIYFSNPFIFYSINSLLTGEDGFTASKEIISRNKDVLIEGIVENQLAQTKEIPYLREWNTYLWFYYTSTGKEIDFIYNGDRYLGIEVKYKEEVSTQEITWAPKIKMIIVLTKNQFEIHRDMLFVPISVFLVCIDKSQKTL